MELANLNTTQLRNACKANRISYGGMSNDGMRAALQAAVDAQLAAVAAEQEAAVNAVAAAAQEVAYAGMVARDRLATFLESDRSLERNEDETGFWTQTDEGPVWTRVDIASLGLYGCGGDEDGARCPHCGTNHMQNGYQTAESLSGDNVKHGLKAEYVCLGCGGEWGPQVSAPKPAPVASKPTGTGLKIQKDRLERNGIKQPSLGGACRSVWDACAEMQIHLAAGQVQLKVAHVKEHAKTMEWNINNAVIEFYRWKKWAAPTPAELEAVPAAPEAPLPTTQEEFMGAVAGILRS